MFNLASCFLHTAAAQAFSICKQHFLSWLHIMLECGCTVWNIFSGFFFTTLNNVSMGMYIQQWNHPPIVCFTLGGIDLTPSSQINHRGRLILSY